MEGPHLKEPMFKHFMLYKAVKSNGTLVLPFLCESSQFGSLNLSPKTAQMLCKASQLALLTKQHLQLCSSKKRKRV